MVPLAVLPYDLQPSKSIEVKGGFILLLKIALTVYCLSTTMSLMTDFKHANIISTWTSTTCFKNQGPCRPCVRPWDLPFVCVFFSVCSG